MKAAPVLLASTLALSLAFGAFAWVKRGPSPALEPPLAMLTTSLGEVVVPDVKACTVAIQNTSDAPLHIRQVEAKCSCTRVRNEQFVLPPHGIRTLPVSYNSKGKSDKQRIVIRIYAEGYREAKPLAADIGIVVPCPERVELPPIRVDKIERVGILLKARNPGVPLQIQAMRYDARLFSVKTEPATRGDVQMWISPQPTLKPGSFATRLTLETNDARDPVKTIQVLGHVLPVIAAESDTVSLGTLKPGETVQRVVHLWSPYGHTFHVVGLLGACQGLKTHWGTQGAQEQQVDFTYTAPPQSTSLNIPVTIITDDPGQQRVSLTLLGVSL